MRLTPDQISAIRSTVQTVLGHAVRVLIVFGSCAQGSARPDSDLDIAVDAGHTLNPQQHLSLVAALAQCTGRPIDLVDMRTAGEPLLGQILQHGQRIDGLAEVQAQYLTRHLLDMADFVPLQQRILQERRTAWIGQ